MSSQTNTQRRGLPKYAYFSRGSGGCGRYRSGQPVTSYSATATIAPVRLGRRRAPRGPDGVRADAVQDVVAARAAHVRGDLVIGGGGVGEVEDHQREEMAADRGLVGGPPGPGALVAEVIGARPPRPGHLRAQVVRLDVVILRQVVTRVATDRRAQDAGQRRAV